MSLRSCLALGLVCSLVAASCSSDESTSPSVSATPSSSSGSGSIDAAVATSDGTTSSTVPAASTDAATTAPPPTDAATTTSTTIDPAAFIATTVADRTLLPPPVDPATVPSDPRHEDVAAAALAAEVLAGGEGAVAAFETALQLSGIGIVDLDGTVVAAGRAPTQNINAEAGEVLMIDDMIANKQSVPLDNFLDMVRALDGDAMSIDDLRADLQVAMYDESNRHAGLTYNFFAYFVDALAAGDDGLVGLLHPLSAGDLISGPQAYLLLLRLAGDIGLQPGFADAPPAGVPRTVHAVQAPTPNNDCNFDTTGSQISDLGAGGLGAFFGKFAPLPGVLEGPVVVAGAVLSIAKLLFSAATFKVSMHLESDPLIRSKDTRPGGDGTLYTKVSFDTGAARYANCFRFMLAPLGLDFSVPNNSVVSGAEVHWSPGVNFGDVVHFTQHGSNRSAVDAVTDDLGEARTSLQGVAQNADLDARYIDYIRHLQVLATFNTKGSSLTQDITDAFGPLLSLANGAAGGVNAVLGIIASLLDRFGFWSARTTIGVKDYYKDILIDTRADYFNPGTNDFPHVNALKCDGVGGDWHLTGEEGSPIDFTLDSTGHGLVADPTGLPAYVVIADTNTHKLTLDNGLLQQSISFQLGDFCED